MRLHDDFCGCNAILAPKLLSDWFDWRGGRSWLVPRVAYRRGKGRAEGLVIHVMPRTMHTLSKYNWALDIVGMLVDGRRVRRAQGSDSSLLFNG